MILPSGLEEAEAFLKQGEDLGHNSCDISGLGEVEALGRQGEDLGHGSCDLCGSGGGRRPLGDKGNIWAMIHFIFPGLRGSPWETRGRFGPRFM